MRTERLGVVLSHKAEHQQGQNCEPHSKILLILINLRTWEDRKESTPSLVCLLFLFWMSNVGFSNHFRFRTKYWQDRQVRASQEVGFLEEAMVQGQRLSQKMFNNRRLQGSNHRSPLSKRRDESNSPLSALKRAEKMKKDNRIALKLQLMSLTIQNYETSRPKSTLSRELRPRVPAYRGKSQLKTDQSFRPSTSLTIQITPRRYQSLQQNIQLIQNNRYSLFLPLKTARMARIHS